MSRTAAVCLALAGVALLLTAVPRLPRPDQSASTTMRVSVNVVRACSVTTPEDASQQLPADPGVRIRCSRAASTSSLAAAGRQAPAQPAVQTTSTADGLVVSVNF